MSFKTILVHADPSPNSDRRLQLAVRVADLFEGFVTGLGAEAFDPVFASGDPMLSGSLVQTVRERIAADLPAAEKRFRALTHGRDGSVWISAADYPDKMLALHARGADLIVAGRPARGENATYSAKPVDLIIEAGAPVLLAADGDTEFRGDRVVVGWKDTRESRRALADSLPFLKRAQGVIIAAVSGEADAIGDPGGLKDVVRRLARHGVDAIVEVAPKGKVSVAETLEDVAGRHGADLIVVGAYGHSRMREWMLGGVTEDLLAASSKFVLLSH
jgi:nucleotide-binding universal stress UspA family protein